MSIRQTYWNQEQEPAGTKTAVRPKPMKAMEDSGDFRNWFRNKFGYDPITKEPEPRMNANGRE